MAEKKEKHYIIENAQLMEEWDWEKNELLGFNPNILTCGSGKKAWWKCREGHEWEASIVNKNKGRGCPHCAQKQRTLTKAKKLLINNGSLADNNPDLASQWHPTQNGNLLPTMVSAGSSRKVWWMCSLGHEWRAAVANRVNGNGCPYCSGRKVLPGFNDLATLYPEIAAEWNISKNEDLLPTMVSVGSGRKVWWMCSLGHEWQAPVVERINGNGCPYCSGHRVLPGFNDLATLYPKIAAEWNISKNGDFLPTMVTAGSSKKVWWSCRKGHEWQANVNSRTRLNTGCPICWQENKTSFPEQAILFYCQQITCAENRNVDFGKEIDIYLREYEIGIEYNGVFWHKNKTGADKNKINFFSEKGIRIITVAEGNQNVVFGDTIEYVYNSSNKASLNWAIRKLFELLGIDDISIDVSRDESEIYNQYISLEKENSLASKYPQIAKQWDFDKNLSLKPEMIMPNSNKKVWWKCDNGHEWQAVVSSRTSGELGCPYCAGQKVLSGYNDLNTTHPQIATEWHPIKNGDLLPTMVSVGARNKVWWVCPTCKESYQAAIYKRTAGRGCPYCSSKKIKPGLNDFASLNPKIASEWHPTKNEDLLPTMVSLHSGRKVWWKCSKGHEWQAIIANRVKGRGCPQCAKEKRKKKS